MYGLEFTQNALRQLKKMDKHTAALILGWLSKNVNGCDNPRQHGKAITAGHKGKWRYRIGDYRVLAQIEDSTVIVLVVHVGHRSEIYRKG